MPLDRECLLERWPRVADGLFDLGYAAGQADQAFDNYRKARYTWDESGQKEIERPVAPEVVDAVVRALCGLTDLPAKPWHKPDAESAYLLEMVVRNQVRGRRAKDLCDAAWEAGERAEAGDYGPLEALKGGGQEIVDMLAEPCGLGHMEAIVGCLAADDKSYCEALQNWRETREDVMRTGHKARIPEVELRRLLEEG